MVNEAKANESGESSSTEELFESLMPFSNQVPLDVLQQWIDSAPLGSDEVQRYVHFRKDRYQRNLMFSGPSFQVLILCWRNGQRSPIHDHVGSNCAVKVLKGVATETVFEDAPNGMIFATGSRHLEEGSTTVSADTDMHQISNLQSDQSDLITLHVYSPPLLEMNAYSTDGAEVSRFIDPINERFVSGAGI